MLRQYRSVRIIFSTTLMYCVILSAAHADSQPWLLVDVTTRTISVLQDDVVVEKFNTIRLGHNGYSIDRRQGDGKTPLGVFHVAWINSKSKFRLFFGLDYPNHERAEIALRNKFINIDTYYAIREALLKGRNPPQETLLGGYIGIHGVGDGDPDIHETIDWTNGCVALSNKQLDRLASWVSVGTKVVISTEPVRAIINDNNKEQPSPKLVGAG